MATRHSGVIRRKIRVPATDRDFVFLALVRGQRPIQFEDDELVGVRLADSSTRTERIVVIVEDADLGGSLAPQGRD
jgi:hypothetical protein